MAPGNPFTICRRPATDKIMIKIDYDLRGDYRDWSMSGGSVVRSYNFYFLYKFSPYLPAFTGSSVDIEDGYYPQFSWRNDKIIDYRPLSTWEIQNPGQTDKTNRPNIIDVGNYTLLLLIH
jgi:hypothetical protein